MEMLTEAHKTVVRQFVTGCFDARVRLAENHSLFAALPQGDKHHRVIKWAQHYGKIAYNSLKHPPPFESGFKEVMALFKSDSAYYNKY
jgi:hypothetical protein